MASPRKAIVESTPKSCLNGIHLTRRGFLRAGSLGLFGLSLSRYLQLKHLMAASGSPAKPEAKAQACILLWLEGGPSQVDTFDPKPNSAFAPISTNVPGIRISELLPRVAQHMDKLSIIRSMYTEEIDHQQATYYAITGHRPNSALESPSLGSIIARELSPRRNMPPYVIAPPIDRPYLNYFNAGFIGARYQPMVVPDPAREDFQVPDLVLPKEIGMDRVSHRRSFLEVVDRLYRHQEQQAEFAALDNFRQQALTTLGSPQVRRAFDLSQESEKTRDEYGRHRFGQSVLLARRLIEGGCRFATAAGYDMTEWDLCHVENDKYNRDLLAPPFDQALSALMKDLDQRGLLESTLVVAMGEFGRTPHVNPRGGRDHWPHCWSMVLGGGGIQGGQVIGASDERGARVADRMVTIGDLFATVYKALGIDWTKEYMTPIQRPVKIANSIGGESGLPIEGLI